MAAPDNLRVVTGQGTSVSLLQRALLALVGLLVLVTAFFFLTVALIAGAILALIIAVRWWWLMRKLRARAAASGPLEGEYTVIEEGSRTDSQPRRPR